MYATVFVNISYGIVVGKSHHLTVKGKTTEECLTNLQEHLGRLVSYSPTLNFRPADGLIFCQEMSPTIPIGVLYRQGYQDWTPGEVG